MLTYLPDESYTISAKLLDTPTLAKTIMFTNQVIKGVVLVNDLLTPFASTSHRTRELSDGYVVNSWRNNLGSLLAYGRALCDEFEIRSTHTAYGVRAMSVKYRQRPKMIHRFYTQYDHFVVDRNIPQDDPWWLGYSEYHRRHMAVLTTENKLNEDRDIPELANTKLPPPIHKINRSGSAGAGRYPVLHPFPEVKGAFIDNASGGTIRLHQEQTLDWEA